MLMNYHIGRLVLSSLCAGAFGAGAPKSFRHDFNCGFKYLWFSSSPLCLSLKQFYACYCRGTEIYYASVIVIRKYSETD